MLAISISSEAASGDAPSGARGRRVLISLRDDASGARVTLNLSRLGAACVTACLTAATAEDAVDFETDFRIHGLVNHE
jgi:hypothetical protein